MSAPSPPRALRLELPSGPGETYFLPVEKRLEGNPLQTLWTQYTDPSKQFFAGVWRSEPGKWRVAYTEEEVCHMLAGRSILTGDDGTVLDVAAGESFVVPRGFTGTWQVVETTTKRFVIYEAATPSGPT